MQKYALNIGECSPGEAGFKGNTNQKLPVVNWLADLPETQLESDLVEVQFKNTRKGYFLNCNKLALTKGEKVVVEMAYGYDLGDVTLTGRLVLLQLKKNRINLEKYIVRRLYRKARQIDLDKYEECKRKEHDTMIRARKLADDLNLNMKIGDVEYQGDGTKAIFYYIADGRVDFRQLIKVFADVFKIKIEMKQIGARQEAGRIGGIGPCGRELCCATWQNNFISVSTNAARIQDISTNPLKLAGQCAKIKCCINYEVPVYADAVADFPSKDFVLQTLESDYYYVKTDVFKRTMTYSTSQNASVNMVTLPMERVQEIISLNKRGKKVDSLFETAPKTEKVQDYHNVVGQDSLTRFDRTKKNPRQNNQNQNRNNQNRNRNNNNNRRPQ